MQQHVYTISNLCEISGIAHAVICPGSRSAPLVFAFTQSGIRCHSVVDERSAGYQALGIAQQTGKPVALICTSGTAVLNFFPAIAEAYYQKIPLLVLTADRPPELLNQQDGQMIMQQNVFGKHVRAAFELPCYLHGKEDFAETAKVIRKAIQQSMGPVKGPVHVNIPLREPLYPASVSRKREQPDIAPVEYTQPSISKADSEKITRLWSQSYRKMVLVGQLPPDGSLTAVLLELSKHPDVTIVCDVLSNQYQFNTAAQFDYLLLRADAALCKALEPDCIVSLGGPVLSKSLKLWLQQIKPTTHIRFDLTGEQVNTYNNVTHRIEGNPALWLFGCALSKPTSNSDYALLWQAANTVIWKAAEDYLKTERWNELSAMRQVLKHIPDAANVQVGNSSIIRYLSYPGNINPSWVMNGNRGTSGIDGCTSTAVGAALANNRPTYLLSGDVAFLYDINALWNTVPHNLKMVVWNNNGGGIFRLIDGPSKHAAQQPYFTTPHSHSLQQIALQKGLEYYFCDSLKSWKQTLRFFANSKKAAMLELKFDAEQNARDFETFKQLSI